MFAPSGTRLVVAVTALAAALAVAGLVVGGWGWALVALAALAWAYTLAFFRDPERTPPSGADALLLAPADGRVVEVTEEDEPDYIQGPAQRVSIALGAVGVHVTRAPARGVVEVVRTVPRPLAAWAPDGACVRTEVGLRHVLGTRVWVRQTAGPVGRWVVQSAARGRRLAAGDRLGVSNLGARVDVVVPPGVELDVAVGQRTVAGETVIGRLSTAASGDGATADVGGLLLEVA